MGKWRLYNGCKVSTQQRSCAWINLDNKKLMKEDVVYSQDKEGDKCDILMREFTEDDNRGFILADLVYDEPLYGDVYKDSGLDILPPAGHSRGAAEAG